MGNTTDISQKELQLARRMERLGILESDLEESFVRSGGHGGQNVNKTSTCVMLKHVPSGIQVKCQETRHQGVNRMIAKELLLEKIESQRRAAKEAVRAELEKERRRKRGRTRAVQLRILASKAHQSAKKKERSRRSFE